MPEGRANQPEGGKAPAPQKYIPAWEGLHDVLARLVQAGRPTQDAKKDICNALAESPSDRKIDFRVMVQVEEDDNDGAPPGYRHIKTVVRSGGHWLNSQQVEIPPSLKPANFNWEHSRPTEPWLTTFASSFADPRIGEEPELRKITSIELRTLSVHQTLLAGHAETTPLLVLSRQSPEASEEFVENTDIEAASSADCYLLPENPPPSTQKAAAAAYRALLTRYPNRRVPPLSMEKLAEIATKISRKNGGIHGRDAVRRALKLRKD
jgi:hypothetical protein